MAVKRAELGQLDAIGEGKVGLVYRTPFRMPAVASPLAFKEFKAATLSQAELRRAISDFRRAVEFRESLPPDDRADLDARTVWPLDLVMDGGRVVGGLLPLIGDAYFATVRPAHLSKPKELPRGLEWLSAPAHLAQTTGFDQTQLDEFSDILVRTAIVAQLVYAVARLHKHGVVYGDISLKNAVFATSHPRVTLLDCDAVAPLSDSSRHQQHSPFFLPPECENVGSNPFARGNAHLQDTRTDVYKLAICIVRGLSQGRGATQVKTADHLAGTLDDQALHAVKMALDRDPDARPTASELYKALAIFVRSRCQPPEIHAFRTASETVPRGSDIVFVWDVSNASAAFLTGPNGFSTPVDPSWGGYTAKAGVSGTYTLQVSRRGATCTQTSNYVHVFDLPEFQLSDVANVSRFVPQVPALPPVEFESILHDVPARPSVEIGTSFVPQLRAPSVEPILSALEPVTAAIMSLANGPLAFVPRYGPVLEQSPMASVANSLVEGAKQVGVVLETSQASLERALSQSTQRGLAASAARIEEQIRRSNGSSGP